MIVIEAQHVYKRYPIARHRGSLRQQGLSLLRGGSLSPSMPTLTDDGVWALRDLSFAVERGERVAVIGRNGAGKTTLLRVLSRISAPTEGAVSVTGRFATLIALSAGFDFERTGMENIFLNAAIQGVPPREVRRILPDILDFAELGAFIDQPVKRYSSGMIARLGFSIAIHILPDIIFLDEVLSVGDTAFQQKCHQRIAALSSSDRTIMLVSHSLEQAVELCPRTIWLHQGQLMQDGDSAQVVAAYQAFLAQQETSGD